MHSFPGRKESDLYPRNFRIKESRFGQRGCGLAVFGRFCAPDPKRSLADTRKARTRPKRRCWTPGACRDTSDTEETHSDSLTQGPGLCTSRRPKRGSLVAGTCRKRRNRRQSSTRQNSKISSYRRRDFLLCPYPTW